MTSGLHMQCFWLAGGCQKGQETEKETVKRRVNESREADTEKGMMLCKEDRIKETSLIKATAPNWTDIHKNLPTESGGVSTEREGESLEKMREM